MSGKFIPAVVGVPANNTQQSEIPDPKHLHFDINPLKIRHILLGIPFHRLLLAGTPTTAKKVKRIYSLRHALGENTQRGRKERSFYSI